MTMISVAASQHAIQASSSWDDFATRIRLQVAEAAQADLQVFAEYGSMSLVTALHEEQRATLAAQLAGLQQFSQQYSALFSDLAQQYQTWIIAPSFPLAVENNIYVNRAWITGPAGEVYYQDKLHMTRFEREQFDISPGKQLQIINTGRFIFAVAICYDCEFPMQVHALVKAGAQLIAVPSCTDAEHGFNRVRFSAQARALENQCFVAQAPLVGSAPWCDAIDINVGRAGIFSPVDRGFPAHGVLADNAADGWCIAQCDLAQMQQVRTDGQVFNLRDWQQPIPQIISNH